MVNFRGYFLVKEKRSNEDQSDSECQSESDNEDFENPDYRDIIHTTSGKYQLYSPSKIRCVAERLQELEEQNGRLILKGEKVVRARFDGMFSQPWWMVEVMTISGSSRAQRAPSVPSYRIRSDDGVDQSVLSLFLTQGCCVNRQYAAALLEFIETRNRRATFVNLLENLEEFASSGEINNEIAAQVKKSFASTPTGKAFLVPELTKVAHRLFPRHVNTLFSSTTLKVLQGIQQALEKEPWILGYQKVLQEKFGISGCEVNLAAYIECGLLETMPVAKRDALYIYNALCKLIHKYGHTFVPLWLLKDDRWYKTPFTPGAYHVTKWEESLTYLREIDTVKTSGNAFNNGCSVFLPHIRGYEQTIVKKICKIMNKRPWVDTMEIDEKFFGGDQDQLKAAQLMTTTPVVVISGRGGCGKTHVVSTVLSKALELKRSQVPVEQCTQQDGTNATEASQQKSEDLKLSSEDCSSPFVASVSSLLPESHRTGEPQNQNTRKDPFDDPILLTAPTGRAASILGKRTGIQAYTLHSVIFSYFRWRKELKSGQNQSGWKFSEVHLLVCDECSLISVKAFSTLINILTKKAALQQIILLGDKNQLPSIEPGNFLRDVYHALEPYGLSITLRTNHRADSQLIVDNAGRIAERMMPVFPDDPKKGFISLCCQSRQTNNGKESDDLVVTQVVRDLLNNKISTIALPEPNKSQFIAFRRRDCLNINELCALHYNKHSIKTPKGRLDFQTGDKVCVRKNMVCFDAYTKEEAKICNGEIFFIKEVIEEKDNREKKTTYFALDDGERILKVDMKLLKRAKLSHAWARTIHTYQGSEIDTIVYVLGSPIYQDWRHVYTAVTRGVRQVIIVHDPNHLKQAVTMSKPFQRRTKLGEFLAKDLKLPSVSDEEESDSEADMLTPPAGDATTRFGVDDHSCQSPNDENASLVYPTATRFALSDACGELCSLRLKIESPNCISCSTNNSNSDSTWENECHDECDDNEVLAWALELECSQQQANTNSPVVQEPSSRDFAGNNRPSEEATTERCRLAGLNNSSLTPGGFSIARSNLNIKKERRCEMECSVEGNSYSIVSHHGSQSVVAPSKSLVAARDTMVRSKRQATHVTVEDPSSQFSKSLPILEYSATNTSLSSVHQVSPLVSGPSTVGDKSPQTPVRRFSKSSAFLTPPRTPPSIKNTVSPQYRLPNTFPQKSCPRRKSFVKSEGTPEKARRRSLTAKFNASCDLCRKSIIAGVDQITHLNSGSTKLWVHEWCALLR